MVLYLYLLLRTSYEDVKFILKDSWLLREWHGKIIKSLPRETTKIALWKLNKTKRQRLKLSEVHTIKTNEQVKHFLESLILAQDERWRRA